MYNRKTAKNVVVDLVKVLTMGFSKVNTSKANTQEIEEMGQPAVLVVSPGVRPWLSKTLKHRTPDLTVLSYVEIPEDQAVKVIKTIAINLKGETK